MDEPSKLEERIDGHEEGGDEEVWNISDLELSLFCHLRIVSGWTTARSDIQKSQTSFRHANFYFTP